MRLALALLLPLWAAAQVTVPFVGCVSDGQTGPVAAPRGATVAVPFSAEIAKELAYFSARGLGVLAPRNWTCFGQYGSAGDTLVVAPGATSPHSSPFRGPEIHLASRMGDTSGRVTVA